MKKPVHTAVFFLMLQCCFLHAQTPDPLSFFPHHQGDIWEYVDPNDTSFYQQNIIVRDSLNEDGRYYIESTLFGRMRVDTSTFEVHSRYYGGSEYSSLLYQLEAASGDTWIVFQNSIYRASARVTSVSVGFIFGQISTIKKIDFYTYRFGDPDSLLGETAYLASDFGLIGQDNDAFAFRRLRGAVIDSIRYGTVTSIDEPPNQLETFTLCQNYPNPFNPLTSISFDLPRPNHVRLTVFDLLGRNVSTLLDERRDAGRHVVQFNASGISSGVLFYQFRAGEFTKTRRMMVVK